MTDIGYKKDGDQPIKEYTGRIPSEHVSRQTLKACISQVGTIQVSISVVCTGQMIESRQRQKTHMQTGKGHK